MKLSSCRRTLLAAFLVTIGCGGVGRETDVRADEQLADGGAGRTDVDASAPAADASVSTTPGCTSSDQCAPDACFGSCVAPTAETVSFDAADDQLGFGAAFDADGTTLAVGTTEIACPTPPASGTCKDKGAVRVFERRNGAWQLGQRLIPNRTGKDDFGSVVALRGDVMAVSAPSYQDCAAGDASCQNHGEVFVFERRNGAWSQTAKLVASDAAPFQVFGKSLVFSGSQLFVGATGDRGCGALADKTDCTDVGAVYVFEKDSKGVWVERQKIKPTDATSNAQVGFSIDVEGDMLVVGAPGHRGCLPGVGEVAPFDSCVHAGAVYVFEKSAGEWEERDRISFRKDVLPEFNGRTVRTSGGEIAVAGALGGNCPTPALASCVRNGVVLVFGKKGQTWEQTAILESGTPEVHAFSGSADGVLDFTDHRLAVTTSHGPASAPRHSIELFQGSGAVWTRVGLLSPQPAPYATDNFTMTFVRIEDAGVMFSTYRAPGCNDGTLSCMARGSVGTFAFH